MFKQFTGNTVYRRSPILEPCRPLIYTTPSQSRNATNSLFYVPYTSRGKTKEKEKNANWFLGQNVEERVKHSRRPQNTERQRVMRRQAIVDVAGELIIRGLLCTTLCTTVDVLLLTSSSCSDTRVKLITIMFRIIIVEWVRLPPCAVKTSPRYTDTNSSFDVMIFN